MKSSSLCARDLLRVLTVVLCSVMIVIMVSGCGGGGGVDALVKERKAIQDEIKAAGADVAKLGEATKKIGPWAEKAKALNADQQKDLKEKLKKEGINLD